MDEIVFETERLFIRLATVADAPFYHQLWTNPEVMAAVGFPQGLSITQADIEDRIQKQANELFEQLLVVILKQSGDVIGECKMHPVGKDGVAETGVKLLPEHWGNKYGIEIKIGLLNYLFSNTDCVAVQATPNVKNVASIKMQEAVGGKCVGDGRFEFPESMQSYTVPLNYYIYQVSREDWERLQK